MSERSYSSLFGSITSAVADIRSRGDQLPPVSEDKRLDGRTCLVTGANSGLGKATAILLAKRGANVLMACRSGIPEVGEDVIRESGNPNVEMIQVDLSDFDSIGRFCNELRDRKITIDIGVFNAGLMPATSRVNKHGFELMFAVNFLAKFVVLNRLLRDGVIPNKVHANNSRPNDPARVIFVSSETHRSSEPIDFDKFGMPAEYGATNGVGHYGMSKLHLTTFAVELSRRLNPDGVTDVAVHALCPGGVNSNMAREAPKLLKPVLNVVFSLFFRSPMDAAQPVVYCACSDEMGEATGKYMHLMRVRDPATEAMDAAKGAMLWQKSETLLAEHGL